MAVDTRDKRMSMIGLAQPVPSMLPDPDGTISNMDQYMLLFLYHGIDVGAGVAADQFTAHIIKLETTAHILKE